MHSALTTITLAVLTLAACAASGLALLRLRRPQTEHGVAQWQHALAWVCAIGSAGAFAYQVLVVHRGWQPLTAHVDGLTLIAAILTIGVVFLETRHRLEGLTAFAWPAIALILAWSVCASAWSYQPFRIDSVWNAVHLVGVYLGTVFCAVAASCGGAYLYVQRRLQLKKDLTGLSRLASLESLELVIVRTATLGFVLLTLGMITGLVITTREPGGLTGGWWYAPKIVLSVLAWLAYAVVMNVRFATAFRGARAAWLSIAGLVLLLATYGVVSALQRHAPHIERPAAMAPGAGDRRQETGHRRNRPGAGSESALTSSPRPRVPASAIQSPVSRLLSPSRSHGGLF